jgi:hypothetical protein
LAQNLYSPLSLENIYEKICQKYCPSRKKENVGRNQVRFLGHNLDNDAEIGGKYCYIRITKQQLILTQT